ncbi:hypothetical protein [Nonlabens xiamenensis]|uniref:hypothetical protein n=1 Tax=Nonlabens xiamenensis TaxID=2341043 RepID=UPI000F613FFD|nr:hypothetical protein [Nonlabens xiamenensis]
MSSVYNKEDYHRHLQQIMPAGYNMNQYGQYLLRDENNGRTIMISLGGRESFPFGVNFDACSLGVTFHEVERIFHDVYVNHSNLSFGHDLDSNTFHDDFSDSVFTRQVIYDDVYPITVEDDASFAQVRPYLQSMLDAAIAFLNT